MLESQWMQMSKRTAAWQQEALDEAMALVLGEGSNASDGSDSSAPAEQKAGDAEAVAPAALAPPLKKETPVMTEEIKAGRKIVSSTVERSRRVFGAIYSALPDELKAQAVVRSTPTRCRLD